MSQQGSDILDSPAASGSGAPQPVPKPSKLSHFVLKTGNLDAMADWYIALTGAHPIYRDDKYCFMTYDEEHHRIGMVQVDGLAPSPVAASGLEHHGFGYESLTELMGVYAALRDRGVRPYRSVNHGVTMSFYYKDPDGNGVELMAENFATAREAYDFVVSDAYRNNPRGFPVDPDVLERRLQAGAPIETLTRFEPMA